MAMTFGDTACFNYIKEKVGDKFLRLKPVEMKWCDYFVKVVNLHVKIKKDNRNLFDGKGNINILENLGDSPYSSRLLSDFSYRYAWDEYVKTQRSKMSRYDEKHIDEIFRDIDWTDLLAYSLSNDKLYIADSLMSRGIRPYYLDQINNFVSGPLSVTKLFEKYDILPNDEEWDDIIKYSDRNYEKLEYWFRKRNVLLGINGLYTAYTNGHAETFKFLAQNIDYELSSLMFLSKYLSEMSGDILQWLIAKHGAREIADAYINTIYQEMVSFNNDDNDIDHFISIIKFIPIIRTATGYNILNTFLPYYNCNYNYKDEIICELLDLMKNLTEYGQFEDLIVIGEYGLLPELSLSYIIYNYILNEGIDTDIAKKLDNTYSGLLKQLRQEIGIVQLNKIYLNPKLSPKTFSDLLKFDVYYQYAPSQTDLDKITNGSDVINAEIYNILSDYISRT